MDSILIIDEELVTSAVGRIATSTLTAYEAARAAGSADAVSWRDAELAVYLVYLFGELKGKGKCLDGQGHNFVDLTNPVGRLAFVQVPPEIAADKNKRKAADMSTFPLTPHGELMYLLVRSNISSFPHVAVRSQFFEAVGRYLDFFKVRKDCIMPVLEALVDERSETRG